MADGVAITAGAGTTIATDDIGGVQYQISKQAFGALDTATLVSDTNPQPAREPKVASATVTQIGDAVTSTQLAAANAARVGLIVSNESTSTMYLKYGTAASSTSFTVKLGSGEIFEMDRPIYTGAVHGIWASDAGGFAYVTDF